MHSARSKNEGIMSIFHLLVQPILAHEQSIFVKNRVLLLMKKKKKKKMMMIMMKMKMKMKQLQTLDDTLCQFLIYRCIHTCIRTHWLVGGRGK
jgi:hypothetical protein